MTSSSTWSPDISILNGIVEILKQADSPNTEIQRQLAEAVSQLDSVVDAPCYYCFLVVDRPQESVKVRQRAGLLLKAQITRLSDKMNGGTVSNNDNSLSIDKMNVLDYIKRNVVRAICDSERIIRDTAAVILASIVSCQGIEKFPQVLPALFQLLNHSTLDIVESAFNALSKIIEDELDRNDFDSFQNSDLFFIDFSRTQLLPKFIQLASNQTAPASQRKEALLCLNLFQKANLFSPGDQLHSFFDAYWTVLGVAANEQDLRLPVLQGMIHIVLMTPDLVISKLNTLLPFVLECLGNQQPYEMKMEALDLLLKLVKQDTSHPSIETVLPQLLPLLIENTKYTQWDYLQMDQTQLEDDNASAPDELHDIVPRFYEQNIKDNEEEETEGDDQDISSSKGVWGEGWTIRKSSAMLLDHLSTIYRKAVLPHILPRIESRLQDKDWESRESAVLILGAIAQGCLEALEPFLPNVLHLLLEMCDDKKPIVRSISIWSIGRFSFWISEQQPEVIKAVAAKILSHVLDRNKKVQEAACSAFAVLEEEARSLLSPYFPDIVKTFNTALQTYQTKNLMVLFDAIGVLSDGIGQVADCALFYENIVEPILNIWSSSPLNDPTLVVAFECLTCVVPAIPTGLPRYSQPIVNRCLQLIRDILNQEDLYSKGEGEKPRRELIDCSLDLISSLCETLPPHIGSPLLINSDFFDLLEKCCNLNSSIVGSTIKQAAFALIGDLAQQTPQLITTRISVLLPQLIPHIANGPVSVCNNASWAIGQIALHAITESAQFDSFVPAICEQLCRVMQAPYSQPSLVRNACITLGRIGRVSPASVAAAMTPVFDLWCRVMENAPNDLEKVNAFNGLCHVVNTKQDLAICNISSFLDSLCSLYHPLSLSSSNPPPPPKIPTETHRILIQVVAWLHNSYNQEWNKSLIELKPQTTQILQSLLSSK